jgi:ABC-type glycerol-3-phosphate transport system substrate-binding protein
MSGGIGIFDYDLESGARIGYVHFLDHGVNADELLDVAILEDGSIICAFRDKIIRFSPIDPAEAPQDVTATTKTTVTLVALSIDTWLQTYIAQFNRENTEYMIEARSYMDETGSEEEALRKFNMDLIAGNIPDIIVRPFYTSSHAYIQKGVFADLYSFMDADSNFNRDDYLPNAISALEQDGSLYEIFPMFLIDTVMGKTSEVGEEYGWTLDEFAAFLDARPDVRHIIGEMTQGRFIRTMVQRMFIDPITGHCSFDRDIFKKILLISERFPEEEPDYMETLRGAASGDPILLRDMLGGFRSIKENEVIYFGEAITYKGYPGNPDRSSLFMPWAKLAIAENASEPDGAWNFIKFMLDNYIDDFAIYLPVKLSELDRLMEEASRRPYWLNEDGTKEEYDYEVVVGTTFGDLGTFVIESNTNEDNEKVMALIRSVTYVRFMDEVLSNIISEEIDAYLSGIRPADATADIIESRINIYISETTG